MNRRRTIAHEAPARPVNAPRASELELAEEAALRAVEKIFGGTPGQSSDFKGALTTQNTRSASIQLSKQQTTATKTGARRRRAHPER